MNQLMDWPITQRYSASKITSRLAQQITRLPIAITVLAWLRRSKSKIT